MNVLPTKDELEVMETIANILLKSGFYQVKTHEQAVATILRGWGLGLSPADSLSGINILHGKLTMSSGLIAALMMRSGFYWKSISHTEQECIIEVFNASDMSLGEASFTMEDAKRADLIRKNANWNVYPKDMLFARTISAAARRYAPVAFGGAVYTPDELEDSNKPVKNDRRLPVQSPIPVEELPASTPETTPAPMPSEEKFDQLFENAPMMTKTQKITMVTLSKTLGYDDDARHVLIEQFTDGRTKTSTELTKSEADDFIDLLKIEELGRGLGDAWQTKTMPYIVKKVSGDSGKTLFQLRGGEIDDALGLVRSVLAKKANHA